MNISKMSSMELAAVETSAMIKFAPNLPQGPSESDVDGFGYPGGPGGPILIAPRTVAIPGSRDGSDAEEDEVSKQKQPKPGMLSFPGEDSDTDVSRAPSRAPSRSPSQSPGGGEGKKSGLSYEPDSRSNKATTLQEEAVQLRKKKRGRNRLHLR